MRDIADIFGSSRGNTKLVASRLADYVDFPFSVFDASQIVEPLFFNQYSSYLFFASTWGDGELQEDMESLFMRLNPDLTGKFYGICELGNYYGYDDFEFGALRIMSHFLTLSGGIELIEPFCMDSLPRKDWEGFERWCVKLVDAVRTK